MNPQVEWLIPVADGGEPVRVEIRGGSVFVDLRKPQRLLSALETAQLSLAMQDVSKAAGAIAARAEGRGKR